MSSVQLYNKLQQYTNKVIRTLGMPALLRRSTGDRSCLVVISDFTNEDRMGRTLDPLASKAIVDARSLSLPPDNEKDRLVTLVPNTTTEEATYRIVERPRPLSPAGVVLLWELTIVKF